MMRTTMRLSIFVKRAILAIAFAAAFVAFSGTAKADPLFFSNVAAVQNGSTRVDLFSNPGITLIGPQLNFLIDVTGTLPAGTTNILQVTYSEAGSAPVVQTFEIPLFGTINPPFTQLVTFTSPGANFTGVFATLTVDIIGSSPDFVIPSGPGAGTLVNSYTYSFNVAQPVPEPATISLMLVGISGVIARARRKR